MRTPIALAVTIPALLLLAACSSPGGPPTPSATSSSSPTPTATRATTLDPCLLVTASEASTLAGASFGAGVESITGDAGQGRRCDYGSQTTNVFFVQVGTSPSADAAQADWAAEEAKADAQIAAGFPAELNPQVNKTDVTGLADKAAVGTGSETLDGHTVSFGVIYLLKGANFLGFGDLTLGTAPTADALKAQAATSLDRMP